MGSEILIILVGFFKWAFKGFKTDLNDEIYGQSKCKQNIRGQNYFKGLFIFIVVILLLSICNTITLHISNIFNENELDENSVGKESLLTANDGKKYKTKSYNLDVKTQLLKLNLLMN